MEVSETLISYQCRENRANHTIRCQGIYITGSYKKWSVLMSLAAPKPTVNFFFFKQLFHSVALWSIFKNIASTLCGALMVVCFYFQAIRMKPQAGSAWCLYLIEGLPCSNPHLFRSVLVSTKKIDCKKIKLTQLIIFKTYLINCLAESEQKIERPYVWFQSRFFLTFF